MIHLILGVSAPFAILVMMGMLCLSLSMMISADNTKLRSAAPPKMPVTPLQPASLRPVEATVCPVTADRILNSLESIGLHFLNSASEYQRALLDDIDGGSGSRHYVIPPTSLKELRKRYGSRRSIWGEWSNEETRQFYKQQLPRALQIEGALGLSLEERARLASEARHALRVYSRERCHLPGRISARLYDGLRHWQIFGYWSSDGMTWEEVKRKYGREARLALGANATEDEVAMYIYKRIVDKACTTNTLFDNIAVHGLMGPEEIMALVHGVFGAEKMSAIAKKLGKERHELGCCDLAAMDCALHSKEEEQEQHQQEQENEGGDYNNMGDTSMTTQESSLGSTQFSPIESSSSSSPFNRFTLPVKTPFHDTPRHYKIMVSLANSLGTMKQQIPHMSMPSFPHINLPQVPTINIPVKWEIPTYSGLNNSDRAMLMERVKSAFLDLTTL